MINIGTTTTSQPQDNLSYRDAVVSPAQSPQQDKQLFDFDDFKTKLTSCLTDILNTLFIGQQFNNLEEVISTAIGKQFISKKRGLPDEQMSQTSQMNSTKPGQEANNVSGGSNKKVRHTLPPNNGSGGRRDQ